MLKQPADRRPAPPGADPAGSPDRPAPAAGPAGRSDRTSAAGPAGRSDRTPPAGPAGRSGQTPPAGPAGRSVRKAADPAGPPDRAASEAAATSEAAAAGRAGAAAGGGGPAAAVRARLWRPVRAWRRRWPWMRRHGWHAAMAVTAVAVGLVVSLATIDLGPFLRAQAERAIGARLDRPVRIGRLGTYLAPGRFLVEDLEIGGLEPGHRPFFTADRVVISTAWLPLLRGEVLVTAVDLQGWRMLVEGFADGRQTFPRLVAPSPPPPPGAPAAAAAPGPPPPDPAPDAAADADEGRRFVTTVERVHARDGEFVYEDHGAPWSVAAPQLDLTMTAAGGYNGRVSFRGGTLRIGAFEPMPLGLDAVYTLDGGLVDLPRIDLRSDGFTAVVDGRVDMLNWPSSRYRIREAAIDLPAMKDVFFAGYEFTVTGGADFTGVWRLFPGGRELTGTFVSDDATLAGLDFPALEGDLVWTRDRFAVTRARSDFYGGRLDFTYGMAPLGADTPAVARFAPQVEGADLDPLFAALGVPGARPLGRAAGRGVLAWPLGRFAARRGEAAVTIAPPEGVALLARGAPPRPAPAGWTYAGRPFDPAAGPWRFPLGADLRLTFDPEGIEIAPGWAATPLTAATFHGRTAWGAETDLPFAVVSADWQESDRVMAAAMTAFGRPTGDLTLAGYGSMTGVLRGALAAPRIEAGFTGDGITAWNVDWGRGTGEIAVEDGVLEVTGGEFRGAGARLGIDGRFAIGAPRPGRAEIDARFAVDAMPARRIRDAFGIAGYPIDGPAFGQIRLYGRYRAPHGFGRLRLGAGLAYGEAFDAAEAGLRFDGDGVWLEGLTVRRGAGQVTGAMHVRWDGTYAANADARGLDLALLRLAAPLPVRLTGRLDAAITGAGAFADPRYAVRGVVRGLAVDDARIGAVTGRVEVADGAMAIDLEASSPDVAVSGAGRVGLAGDLPAEIRLSVTGTRLDPFVRVARPGLTGLPAWVASGAVRVDGPLRDPARLRGAVAVDQTTLAWGDYAVRNDGPVRLALDDRVVRIDRLRLQGEGTGIDLAGELALPDWDLDLQAAGEASLDVLPVLLPDVRSRGRVRLEVDVGGSWAAPVITGEARVAGGRIRRLAWPHALDAIDGRLVLEPGGVRLDRLTAELGGGSVRFGGRIGLDGARVGELGVTAAGRNVALRYPDGIRSRIDADLTLGGSAAAPILGGQITVQDAIWLDLFDFDGGLLDLAGGGSGAAPAAGAGEEGVPLQLDLRVTAPSSLRIADNRAQIVASADLTLTGTADRPALLGYAEIDRGQLYVEGNRYRLTRGRVAFANPVTIEPFFDVEAETDVRVPGQTYRVTLGLSGTPARLAPPTLESDPPLQQVEIIGLLLGDVRDPQQAEIRALRAPEATQQALLVQAAGAWLLNNPVSAGVGSMVERSFGVDTFEITPSLDDPASRRSTQLAPTARVLIGKRISDRAHLTLSRAVSGSNQDLIVLLEYDASDRLSWVLSQNEDRTYAVDVRVRHAF